MINLQEEVRALHFLVKQKDITIEKLKTAYIEASRQQKESHGEEVPREDNEENAVDKVSALLEKDEQLDKSRHEFQQELIKALTTVDKQLLNEDSQQFNQSILFSQKDIVQLIKGINEYKQTISSLENKNEQFHNQIHELQTELKSQIEKEQPNIQEITQKMVKEKLDEETAKFKFREEQLIRDLQNRVEKVLKLEMDLDEVKDAYRLLEASLSKDEQQFKNKALRLEKSLDQITQMYQQVINEKSVLKVDLQVAEKKAQRKEEKITQLEKSLAISREKVILMFKLYSNLSTNK